MIDKPRPVALITGVGRRAGLGFAVAERLAQDGFDIAVTHWATYDERMPWGADAGIDDAVSESLSRADVNYFSVAANFESADAPANLIDEVEAKLGPISVLVLCHCESVNTCLLDTTVESFDRHMAVNARACMLLMGAFARRFSAEPGRGRIVALTSDAVVGNVPYGASKAALDRIVVAAAHEFGHLGITVNALNPGPTQTGWMTTKMQEVVVRDTPLGRLGTAQDVANVVGFLCSPEGGWVNGQILHSNGGLYER